MKNETRNLKRTIQGEAGSKRKKDKKNKERVEEWNVVFWNVARLKNKDRSFWKGLSEWDVIVLTETWTEVKDERR